MTRVARATSFIGSSKRCVLARSTCGMVRRLSLKSSRSDQSFPACELQDLIAVYRYMRNFTCVVLKACSWAGPAKLRIRSRAKMLRKLQHDAIERALNI